MCVVATAVAGASKEFCFFLMSANRLGLGDIERRDRLGDAVKNVFSGVCGEKRKFLRIRQILKSYVNFLRLCGQLLDFCEVISLFLGYLGNLLIFF